MEVPHLRDTRGLTEWVWSTGNLGTETERSDEEYARHLIGDNARRANREIPTNNLTRESSHNCDAQLDESRFNSGAERELIDPNDDVIAATIELVD
jgi:hypothetical protein